MKNNKNNKNRFSIGIIVILLAVLIAVGGISYYFLIHKPADNNTIRQTNDRSEVNTEKKAVPKPEKNNSKKSNSNHESEKNITPQYSSDDANNSPSLTGAINFKSVVDGNLMIRTTIDQMVSGTCQLKLTNGQRVVTKESAIAQNPSSSTCEGFNVPTNELGSGNWQIEIQTSGDGKTGTLKDSVTI